MDTIEYATFRYDTVEVENGLNRWEICLLMREQNESRKLRGIHVKRVYKRAQEI